jgi:hypothetical protein
VGSTPWRDFYPIGHFENRAKSVGGDRRVIQLTWQAMSR